jgi:regulator of RNase E activity RraA
MIPEDDAALFPWIADNLYTAVLSDSCDGMGRMNQALGPEIRPTDENLILVGRAKTVLWSDLYHVPEGNPYEGEIQAVDSIRPGDIVVMATGASKRNAPVG